MARIPFPNRRLKRIHSHRPPHLTATIPAVSWLASDLDSKKCDSLVFEIFKRLEPLFLGALIPPRAPRCCACPALQRFPQTAVRTTLCAQLRSLLSCLDNNFSSHPLCFAPLHVSPSSSSSSLPSYRFPISSSFRSFEPTSGFVLSALNLQYPPHPTNCHNDYVESLHYSISRLSIKYEEGGGEVFHVVGA